MKLSFLLFFSTLFSFSQQATNVYLFQLEYADKAIAEAINISANSGYNNQPSFANDSTVLFAKTRNNQTDIASYHINTKITHWLTNTSQRSEYSPLQIPNNAHIASVGLDTTGLQRLYYFDTKHNRSETVNGSLVIGYHAWLDADELITFVLGNEPALVYLNLNNRTTIEVTRNVGRSLHKVPNSELMSYTSINSDGIHEVYLLDIKGAMKSYYVCDLPIGVQDYTWINRDVLLIGSSDTLYTYDTFVDEDWQKFASLKPWNLKAITRLSVSPNTKHLAVVVSSDE